MWHATAMSTVGGLHLRWRTGTILLGWGWACTLWYSKMAGSYWTSDVSFIAMSMFVYWKVNDKIRVAMYIAMKCNKAYSSRETGSVIVAEVKAQRGQKESKQVTCARVMSIRVFQHGGFQLFLSHSFGHRKHLPWAPSTSVVSWPKILIFHGMVRMAQGDGCGCWDHLLRSFAASRCHVSRGCPAESLSVSIASLSPSLMVAAWWRHSLGFHQAAKLSEWRLPSHSTSCLHWITQSFHSFVLNPFKTILLVFCTSTWTCFFSNTHGPRIRDAKQHVPRWLWQPKVPPAGNTNAPLLLGLFLVRQGAPAWKFDIVMGLMVRLQFIC